jgi:hypothetical protein
MKEQTLDQQRDSSILGKLSGRTRKAIEALTTSRLAEQALEQVEKETLAERQALVAELVALTKRMPADLAKAAADVPKALRAYEAAEDAFRRASQVLRDAREHGARVETTLGNEHSRLTRALQATADSRLADFVFRLEGLIASDLVVALQCWPDKQKKDRGIEPAISSNLAEVIAAKDAARAAIADAERLRLEAIGYEDVSVHLFEACERLAPVLARVEVNPPTLTATDAEPGRPLPFRSGSQWIIDGTREVTKEDRATEREVRAKRIAASERVN